MTSVNNNGGTSTLALHPESNSENSLFKVSTDSTQMLSPF